MPKADHFTTTARVCIDVSPSTTLFVGDDDCLWVRERQGSQTLSEVRIGPATVMLLQEIMDACQRLKIHAVSDL
jgi:hypothetical protein